MVCLLYLRLMEPVVIMIRNNLKSLLFYFLILIMTFVSLFVFQIGSNLVENNYNNNIVKGLFVLANLSLYFFMGRFIGIKSSRRHDFKSLILLMLISIGIYFYGVKYGSFSINSTLVDQSLPLALFLSPVIMTSIVLGFEFNILFLVVYFIIASIIVGLVIKRYRSIYQKRTNKRIRRRTFK